MDTNLSTPSNALTGSTGYAHSASWLQECAGQVILAPDGATLQVLDLHSIGMTTALASDVQSLSVIVFEGTVEVILQGAPVFTISRGGHWAVDVGKECRVRNLDTGSNAILYVVGMTIKEIEE